MAALCVVLAKAFPPGASAYQDGVTGFSGLQGPACADRCHGNGPAPFPAVEGPSVVAPGATVSWRIHVTFDAATAVAGGLNVAASHGQLVAGPGLYEEAGELTHLAPQRSADSNADGAVTAADAVHTVRLLSAPTATPFCAPADVSGDGVTGGDDLLALAERLFDGGQAVSWRALWRAPRERGPVRFSAAVVTANCNGTNGGDGYARVSWQVEVGASNTLAGRH